MSILISSALVLAMKLMTVGRSKRVRGRRVSRLVPLKVLPKAIVISPTAEGKGCWPILLCQGSCTAPWTHCRQYQCIQSITVSVLLPSLVAIPLSKVSLNQVITLIMISYSAHSFITAHVIPHHYSHLLVPIYNSSGYIIIAGVRAQFPLLSSRAV